MRSMEELPSSHAEAIEDLEEMQLLAAPLLWTPSVHSDIWSSCCKVMVDALIFKEHEVGPSLSPFSDCDCGLLEAAVKQCTWEREMLPRTVPCGEDKPRNCLPQKRECRHEDLHHSCCRSVHCPHKTGLSTNTTTVFGTVLHKACQGLFQNPDKRRSMEVCQGLLSARRQPVIN